MKRYFFKIAYKGSNYHGWQMQPNAETIQEFIEDALGILLGENTPTLGCGRTDTGVHAKEYYFHLDYKGELEQLLQYKLNKMLPKDIVVNDIFEVQYFAHARFSAVKRTYQYHIHAKKNPFLIGVSTYLPFHYDLEKLNYCSKLLMNYSDFTGFSKISKDVGTHNCTIFNAYWEKEETDSMIFNITANRFLRGMVRILVGTMLDVGRGKKTTESFEKILSSKNRQMASGAAASDGLYLSKVEYPKEIYL